MRADSQTLDPFSTFPSTPAGSWIIIRATRIRSQPSRMLPSQEVVLTHCVMTVAPNLSSNSTFFFSKMVLEKVYFVLEDNYTHIHTISIIISSALCETQINKVNRLNCKRVLLSHLLVH